MYHKFLHKVKRPFRYYPSEWGLPPVKEGKLSFCLVFPDVYEVGMSYVGFKILYWILNGIDGVRVERAYCPWPDAEKYMRENSIPLYSVESQTPLNEFDVLGITLQYEMTYTNILTILDLAGLPLKWEDRDNRFPLVIAGGPGALSPFPLFNFFDAFLLGDGEELIERVAKLLLDYHPKFVKRDSLLKTLSKEEGILVPAFFESQISDSKRIKKQIVVDLDKAFYPEKMIVPSSDIVHDRLPIEVFRGCTRGCRFCHAGMIYRPVRERSPERIFEISKKLLDYTGWDEIGLLSLATCDYSRLIKLLELLIPYIKEKRVKISLPSLRMDSFSIDIAERILGVKKGGLTFAPEAGSQRLRNVINKGVSDEDIRFVVEETFKRGWNRLKFYFMIGLPTETFQDINGIIEISSWAVKTAKSFNKRAEISLSVAPFVPKPYTPFQWERQCEINEIKERINYLKGKLRRLKGIKFNYHNPELSFLEAVIARGDRKLSDVIQKAWENGARFDSWDELFDFNIWLKAFEDTGISPYDYTKKRDIKEPLPWDVIDIGVTKSFLLKERERAYKGILTFDCREKGCNGCGISPDLCKVAFGR